MLATPNRIRQLLAVALLGSACANPIDESEDAELDADTSSLTSGEPLQVSGHYLKGQTTGKPTLVLGDTAWLLLGQNRADILTYLNDRKSKGFNMVMVAIDPEKANAYGDKAFAPRADGKPDVTAPYVTPGADPANAAQYDYWDHLRFAVQSARDRGLTFLLVTAFNNELWDYNGNESKAYIDSPTLAYSYGKNIGEQLRNHRSAIVFSAGGDRAVQWGNRDKRPFYRALAEGMTDGANAVGSFDLTANWSTTIVTHEPPVFSPGATHLFPGETWLDISSIEAYPNQGPVRIADDFKASPVKPTWVIEGMYENPREGVPWLARYEAYTTVFSGAMGFMYGANEVMKFAPEWKERLNLPGASQMKYLTKLMNVWGDAGYMARVPDQSLLVKPGSIPAGFTVGGDLQVATRSGGTRAMVYAMNGRGIGLKLAGLTGPSMRAYWFNPRNGKWHKDGVESDTRTTSTAFATVPAGAGAPNYTFDPPGAPAPDNDWVLVLESTSSAAPSVLGNDQVGTKTDTLQNFVVFFSHQATGDLNLTKMSIHLSQGSTSSADKLKMAIYADNNGYPGALLRTTTEGAALASGWRTLNLATPLSVTAGTKVWLAVWANTKAYVVTAESESSLNMFVARSYASTWPSPMPTGAANWSLEYDLYAQ
ncbi:MAG: DUF4038 domain-containing protein [Polyangiaceae bacterium]